MDVRKVLFFISIAATPIATAQQIHSAAGPQPVPKYEPKRAQPNNLGATPLNCPQHVDPRMRLLCNDIERTLVQSEAKRQGLPVPSANIVKLPALGSADAKTFGAACVGGTAMRRLSNGWEQLRDGQGNWLRCREQ